MVTTFDSLLAQYSRIVSEGRYLSPEDTKSLADFFFSGKDAVAKAQTKILTTLERYLERPRDDVVNICTKEKLIA